MLIIYSFIYTAIIIILVQSNIDCTSTYRLAFLAYHSSLTALDLIKAYLYYFQSSIFFQDLLGPAPFLENYLTCLRSIVNSHLQ